MGERQHPPPHGIVTMERINRLESTKIQKFKTDVTSVIGHEKPSVTNGQKHYVVADTLLSSFFDHLLHFEEVCTR